MNLRHDQRSCVAQSPPVVAQSSRSQSRIGFHTYFAAHIFKSSQCAASNQKLGARLFFKPGQYLLGGQHTNAGHTFTPDQDADVYQKRPVRRSLQPAQRQAETHCRGGWHFFNATSSRTFPSLDASRVLHGGQNSCVSHQPCVATLSREPNHIRDPMFVRSRPFFDQPRAATLPTHGAAGRFFKPTPKADRQPISLRLGTSSTVTTRQAKTSSRTSPCLLGQSTTRRTQ